MKFTWNNKRHLPILIPALVGIVALLTQGIVYGLHFTLQLVGILCGYWILFYVSFLLRKRDGILGKIMTVVAWGSVAVAGIFLLLFLFVEGIILYHQDGDDPIPNNVQTVLVLGCQVEGEVPSQMLERRLLAALEFLEERPESNAILCGGQGSGENISEAECMSRWLQDRGISEDRLILEDKSINTRENIDNAVSLLREKDPTIRDVAVATTGFHLFRGKKLCEFAGLNAYGLSGEMSSNLAVAVNSYLREFASIFFMYVGEISA